MSDNHPERRRRYTADSLRYESQRRDLTDRQRKVTTDHILAVMRAEKVHAERERAQHEAHTAEVRAGRNHDTDPTAEAFAALIREGDRL